MEKIQIISISVSVLFLAYIGYLIVKGKLREEYSIIWIICTLVLVVFSFWRNGLEVFADILGVIAPPNIVFTAAIFAILVYLLHLSVVLSKLQGQNKILSQEISLLKQKIKEKETNENKLNNIESD
ncbi:MAG: DUF2304 domain-containing protein [Bacteroidota bacterium]|jgi:hypothetical protein